MSKAEAGGVPEGALRRALQQIADLGQRYDDPAEAANAAAAIAGEALASPPPAPPPMEYLHTEECWASEQPQCLSSCREAWIKRGVSAEGLAALVAEMRDWAENLIADHEQSEAVNTRHWADRLERLRATQGEP